MRGRGLRGPPPKRFKLRPMSLLGQIREENEAQPEGIITAQARIVSEMPRVIGRRLTDEEAETVRGNGTLILKGRLLSEEEVRALSAPVPIATAVLCSSPPESQESPPASPQRPLIPYPPAGKCGVCATDVSEGEKRMVGAQCVHDRCAAGVADDAFRAFCQKCGLGVWQRRDEGRRGDGKRYWHGECAAAPK
jgi:hypothetical protein